MNTSGKVLMHSLKEIAGCKGPNLVLPVKGFQGFVLRPIATKREHINSQDVVNLTAWRNLYPKSFLTELLATDAQTYSWLCEKVHCDNKLLFMIEGSAGFSIGYMGIGFIDWQKSYVEADSIVSGGSHPRGLMTAALISLLQWSKGQLGLNNVAIRVLSDNPALIFYRRLGFVEAKRVPLIRIDRKTYFEWVEDENALNSERHLVYHNWSENSIN